MTSRKLSLRRERLAELTTSELRSVAGASGAPCEISVFTNIPTDCNCTGYYPSIFDPCVID